MKMVVQPAKRIRNGTVEIPERVFVGNLNSSPNGRFNSLKGYFELIDRIELLATTVGFGLSGIWFRPFSFIVLLVHGQSVLYECHPMFATLFTPLA